MKHDPTHLTWCDISLRALSHNAQVIKSHLGPAELGVVVKANAYGHGIVQASRAFLAGGASWLVVNTLPEAETIREAGITAPIHMVGPTLPSQAARIVGAQIRPTVYDPELVDALQAAALDQQTQQSVFIKIETGTHRQGLELPDALALGRRISRAPNLQLAGLSTHYADIEDTTDHSFAMGQHLKLLAAQAAFRELGFSPKISGANSAATLLWPKTHGDLVRVGISAYGLWPSAETYAAALALPEARGGRGGFIPELRPALHWRCRIAQVKTLNPGDFVGYGRTYRATHPMRLAILPVGYHEGYDRRLSNLGYALVHGTRAPICGRVCMNMIMVDVTDIPDAQAGSIATLLGTDGDECIHPNTMAGWAQTISYEILSRILPAIPRCPTDDALPSRLDSRPAASTQPPPNVDPS